MAAGISTLASVTLYRVSTYFPIYINGLLGGYPDESEPKYIYSSLNTEAHHDQVGSEFYRYLALIDKAKKILITYGGRHLLVI